MTQNEIAETALRIPGQDDSLGDAARDGLKNEWRTIREIEMKMNCILPRIHDGKKRKLRKNLKKNCLYRKSIQSSMF